MVRREKSRPRKFRMTSAFTLNDLAAVIAQRAGASADSSYTKSLLDAGPPRAAKKFGEEAVEAVIAAIEGDSKALTSEAADVLYHLLVLLRSITGNIICRHGRRRICVMGWLW